jgi:hypothetical protein
LPSLRNGSEKVNLPSARVHMQHILYDKFSYDKFYLLVHVNVSEKGVYRRHGNRWEICLRMRYNFRGLRERYLGRVNIVI